MKVVKDLELNPLIEESTTKNGRWSHRKTEDPLTDTGQRYSHKQIVILCLLSAGEFVRSCSLAILPVVFPIEARVKGISLTISGFVFSSYALIMVIICPIMGKIIPLVGVKFVYIAGLAVTGTCNIIFGCLTYFNDYYAFTIMSFIIRSLEAIGSSGYITCVYVIVFNEFPNYEATVRGVVEIFVGLGFTIGPVMGGVMYSIGGYGLPFYIVGALTILLALINLVLLKIEERVALTSSTSLRSIFKIPSVLVTCALIVIFSSSWSALDPTLEPALSKFNLSPEYVGLIFMILPAVYALSCPIFGWAIYKIKSYRILIISGLALVCLSYLLVEPSLIFPFLGDNITLKIISLCLLGIGLGMGLLPNYQLLQDMAMFDCGFENGITTNSFLSGLWATLNSLGEIIGPALAGMIMENWDFSTATTAVAILNLVAAIGGTIYYSTRKTL